MQDMAIKDKVLGDLQTSMDDRVAKRSFNAKPLLTITIDSADGGVEEEPIDESVPSDDGVDPRLDAIIKGKKGE